MLVLLHALVLEQFKEAAVGFLWSKVCTKAKHLPPNSPWSPSSWRRKLQHAFASDHFKVAFLVWGPEKAAVDSHCQRTVRRREPIPVALTAVDKAALFLTQFPLQALRYIRDVLANGEGVLTCSSIGSTSCKSFDVIP